jgi:glutathione S-transferase
MPLPILYSLQHCPYAMRARMALLLAKQAVELRAIVLKNKPTEMLIASPKGTVPVLIVDQISVIDESIDIMIWALQRNDPQNLLYNDRAKILPAMLSLINRNDNEFKICLEKYKHAKRYHDISKVHYRQQCENFILHLEQRLSSNNFFMGEKPSLADYAILPFIRQFSRVERKWFLQAPYPNLRWWVKRHIESKLFSKTMKKYPLWLDTHESVILGHKIIAGS